MGRHSVLSSFNYYHYFILLLLIIIILLLLLLFHFSFSFHPNIVVQVHIYHWTDCSQILDLIDLFLYIPVNNFSVSDCEVVQGPRLGF